MRQLVTAGLLAMGAVVALTACATMALPDSRGALLRSVQDFSQRLRWKDVNGAARYLPSEHAAEYRQQFEDNEDLHIVDVRVERVDMPEAGRATVWLVVQFYELPSVTIQRSRIEQEWTLQTDDSSLAGEWKIDGAFPHLSVSADRSDSQSENQ